MSREFEPLEDGDRLEPFHLNIIYAELRRLRKMKAAPPLVLRGMDSDQPPILTDAGSTQHLIRLTANGDSDGLHDWKLVHWDGDAIDYEDAEITGSVDDGDAARELNGLQCPLGDEVYWAWRDNFGVLTFRAVRVLGVSIAAIAAGATGTVSVWSYDGGTAADSGLDVEATNWNNLTGVAASKRIMLTPCCGKWLIDFEAC